MGKSISLLDLFQPTAGRNESHAFWMVLCPACRCYPFLLLPNYVLEDWVYSVDYLTLYQYRQETYSISAKNIHKYSPFVE